MADKSKIQWCDATINPAYGCSPVSPACDHCYAARMAGRLGELTQGTHQDGKWTGRINLFPERMMQALKWREPRRIFIGSMTDLFHPDVPYDFLDRVFAVMAMCPQHEFILLTKRASRMREYLQSCPWSWREGKGVVAYWAHHLGGVTYSLTGSIKQDNHVEASIEGRLNCSVGWPMRHVMLMATIEDQPRADERMPHLMALAGMGWRTGVSVEPMLGPVDFRNVTVSDKGGIRKAWDVLRGTSTTHHPVFGGGGIAPGRLSWVIAGGESGPGARPMHPAWVRSLRDQCQAAGVPFFFKQWGEWLPMDQTGAPKPGAKARSLPPSKTHWMGQSGEHRPVGQGRNTEDVLMLRVGKHAAGRLLDGVEHNAFPEVRS